MVWTVHPLIKVVNLQPLKANQLEGCWLSGYLIGGPCRSIGRSEEAEDSPWPRHHEAADEEDLIATQASQEGVIPSQPHFPHFVIILATMVPSDLIAVLIRAHTFGHILACNSKSPSMRFESCAFTQFNRSNSKAIRSASETRFMFGDC